MLTVSIDVHGTGVALSVVVGVYLGGVVLVGTVVTAVSHVVLVKVKLPGVVEQRAVVLEGRKCKCFFSRCHSSFHSRSEVNEQIFSGEKKGQRSLTHPLVHDSIVVIVFVAGVSLTVFVEVFLARVWQAWAVILQKQPAISICTHKE